MLMQIQANTTSFEYQLTLLLVQKVAKTFKLWTVSYTHHLMMHVACGLLADDNEWNEVLREASTSHQQDNFVICSIWYYCFLKLQPKRVVWKSLKGPYGWFSYIIWGLDTRNIELHVQDFEQKHWQLLEIEYILTKINRSLRELSPMSLSSSE